MRPDDHPARRRDHRRRAQPSASRRTELRGMSFELRGETVIGAHSLEELKLVYRVLHRHLAAHTELMDTHFLIELQNFLHAQASADGVDTANHRDRKSGV